jgi:hypothetical protein
MNLDFLSSPSIQSNFKPIIGLVGTKCDLDNEQTVGESSVEAFANKHHLVFLEASAKTGVNVAKAFGTLGELQVKLALNFDLHLTIFSCGTSRKRRKR